jgi:hypothetical protein
LKDHLKVTSTVNLEANVADLTSTLKGIFPEAGFDFESKKFKSIITSNFNTTIQKRCFRDWEYSTVKGFSFDKTAVSDLDFSQHYAVQKAGETTYYLLHYTPTVHASIQVDDLDKVIKVTVNGMKIPGACDFPLTRLQQLLHFCKPCDMRKSGACPQLT